MHLKMVPIERLAANPKNLRSDTDKRSEELVASIQISGIQVALIGYVDSQMIELLDGHCRLAAARIIGLKELPVIVFDQKPTDTEMLSAQLTINGRRHGLNPIDEYEACHKLATLKQWSHSELAAGLGISNSKVTRIMSVGKLTPEERRLLLEEKISLSAAYSLTRHAAEGRSEMAVKAAAGQVTRDDLNRRVRKDKRTDAVKARRMNFQVPGGTIAVQSGDGLDLGSLIDLLEGFIKECRKARSQGLDISTAARVLRDRNRLQQVQ